MKQLSRKVLAGLGAVAGLGIGAALLVSLLPAHQGAANESFSTADHQRPEGLASLPHN